MATQTLSPSDRTNGEGESRPNLCKYCQSPHIRKYGKYNGVQRYFCNDCRRKFKADGSLFHMKVPARYVTTALNQYYTGMSIGDVSKILNQEYQYAPSKHIVYQWIDKYTDLAIKHVRDDHPKVGSVWVADETMLDINGRKVWFWDIIDTKTRYLLASRVSDTRTTADAEWLMKAAYRRAGKAPTEVRTDKLRAYLDGVELTFGADTNHVQGGPFKVVDSGESTSKIERFHNTLKDRTKVMRGFKDEQTLIQFTDGFLVFYNYFRPHEALKGKTPAEVAGLGNKVRNWGDLCRLPVSKQDEIKTHSGKAPRPRITQRMPRISPKAVKLS